MPLPSTITSITHNIPAFLRDPAVALIGERCYTVLVYDFNVTHSECLKYAISKGLGLGIVLGGSIVKIPQIVKIVSARSAKGLSLSAYILETASYAINLAYASRNRFPFSTYGENLFLTIQNVIITLLIIAMSGRKGHDSEKKLLTGVVSSALIGVVLWSEKLCPAGFLSLLQAATLPLSLLSKAPQILSNHQNRSTGNLSAFAVFNALLGCMARLYTTKQEVNDSLIFWGFAGAAVLNLVLAGQMVFYWQTEPQLRRRPTEDQLFDLPEKADGGTPTKRWGRKLD